MQQSLFLQKLWLKNFVFLLLYISFFTGCAYQDKGIIEDVTFALGTTCSIKIYNSTNTEAIEKAFKEVHAIEQRMSVNIEESEISRINQNSGSAEITVSPDTYHVINTALHYSRISEGRFDITIGPLVDLWDITAKNPRVPNRSAIGETKQLVNYNHLRLDKNKKTVFLNKTGMSIDVGGIAKGWAADQSIEILKKHGIKHALLNFGGNLITLGTKPDGSNWVIGVQDPGSVRGNYIGYFMVANQASVTSGKYERFFEENGTRYHHLLDPATGYPIENNLASVTIVHNKSIIADALSTTIFMLGLEKGMALVESLENTETVIITENKEIYLSQGLKDNFQLTDTDYTLKKEGL